MRFKCKRLVAVCMAISMPLTASCAMALENRSSIAVADSKAAETVEEASTVITVKGTHKNIRVESTEDEAYKISTSDNSGLTYELVDSGKELKSTWSDKDNGQVLGEKYIYYKDYTVTLESTGEYRIQAKGEKSGRQLLDLLFKVHDNNINSKTHDWKNAKVTVDKEVSCEENGQRTLTCECGLTKTEIIEAKGHDWGEGIVTTAPTNDKAGVRTYTCSRCGKTKTEPIDANNHAWDSGKVIKEPTCSEEGEMLYTCTVCKKTKVEPIDKKQHTWGVPTVFVQPTDTTSGKQKVTCKTCGATEEQLTEPLKGHAWDEGTVTTPVTDNDDGVKTYKCTVCGQTKTERIRRIANAKLEKELYTYDGTKKYPKVTVTDTNGDEVDSQYYTVEYDDDTTVSKNPCQLVGRYYVDVSFKGDYFGTEKKRLMFTIRPKQTTLNSVKAGKNSLTVNWTAAKEQTTGYFISYSTDKNFKNSVTIRVKDINRTSKVIKSLKTNKKYWVRVAPYKLVNTRTDDGVTTERIKAAWSVRTIMEQPK